MILDCPKCGVVDDARDLIDFDNWKWLCCEAPVVDDIREHRASNESVIWYAQQLVAASAQTEPSMVDELIAERRAAARADQ